MTASRTCPACDIQSTGPTLNGHTDGASDDRWIEYGEWRMWCDIMTYHLTESLSPTTDDIRNTFYAT
jgi:hypothetical protein